VSNIIRIEKANQLPYLANIEKVVAHYPWGIANITNAFNHQDTFFAFDDYSGYYCISLIGDTAELNSIAILPKAQGDGLGLRLINHMISYCKLHRVKNIFLEVAVDNVKAKSLYTKVGFRQINIRSNYYQDGKDAQVMKLIL